MFAAVGRAIDARLGTATRRHDPRRIGIDRMNVPEFERIAARSRTSRPAVAAIDGAKHHPAVSGGPDDLVGYGVNGLQQLRRAARLLRDANGGRQRLGRDDARGNRGRCTPRQYRIEQC